MACAAIEAVHRRHRVRESARARAARVEVHPRDLHRRPGDGHAGRRASCSACARRGRRRKCTRSCSKCGILAGTSDGPEHPAPAAALHSRGSSTSTCLRDALSHLRMKRFLDLADLPRDEIRALLDLARRLETQPEPQALAGKILGLVFFNPSLRTLASFQAGMSRLGGTSFVITPGQGTWQLETRHGRRDERRGGRARARRHSGARVLLRRARHPRVRGRQGPALRPRRDRLQRDGGRGRRSRSSISSPR